MAKNQKSFFPEFGFQKIIRAIKRPRDKFNIVSWIKEPFAAFPYWLLPIIVDRSGLAAGIARHPFYPNAWSGYVLLPRGHKYFKAEANNIPYRVHGVISYHEYYKDHLIIGWVNMHNNKVPAIKEALCLYDQAKEDMLPFFKRFFNWIK